METMPVQLCLYRGKLLRCSLFILASISVVHATVVPQGFVAPITRDPRSSLYVMPLLQRTPLQPENVMVDIESDNLWVECSPKYRSSTFRPVACGTSFCKASGSILCTTTCDGPQAPGCNNNTCGLFISNSAIDTTTSGDLSLDTIAIRSTDGSSAGPLVTISNYGFGCGTDLLLQNGSVPAGVTGIAGFSRQTLSLPTQLAELKGIARKFAYCLPSSTGTGVIFLGDSPYVFLPGIDVSKQLRFIPFLRNRGFPDLYYIAINGITVDGKKLNYDSSPLKIRKDGEGGIKITSTTIYTRLASPIYVALRDAFVRAAAARGIKRVPGVRPFDACFDATSTTSTRLGYAVPEIDLLLQGQVVWQIFGANSVVSVSNKLFCFAFQDAGPTPTTGIEVGTYQQQDHLLQFDLGGSRLGFTPSLLGSQTTCSNFKF